MEVHEALAAKLTKPLEQMLDRVGVDAAFGATRREGDAYVIPVSESLFGVGFGFGSGTAPGGGGTARVPDVDAEASEDDDEAGTPAAAVSSGEGSGGGGGGLGGTRPVGFIKVSEGSVSYEPVLDQSRIAMAGILLSAWSVLWVSLAIRAIAGAVGSRAAE